MTKHKEKALRLGRARYSLGDAITIPRGYTRTGLNLPSGLVFSDWLEIGRRLQFVDAAVQWCFADWWAFGEARYRRL